MWGRVNTVRARESGAARAGSAGYGLLLAFDDVHRIRALDGRPVSGVADQDSLGAALVQVHVLRFEVEQQIQVANRPPVLDGTPRRRCTSAR